MKRVPEPELMNEAQQAEAYASTDFSESHNAVVQRFLEVFQNFPQTGKILELGCGPGDVTFRFARALPKATFVAVDGAEAMLEFAKKASAAQPEIESRIEWVCAYVPGEKIPAGPYDAITSNSLLHHLHDPLPMWRFIATMRAPKAKVFMVDLRRPESAEDAWSIIDVHAPDAAEILQRDFFNSLCAAFTVEEVRDQLHEAGLADLAVEAFGENYLVIYG